MLTVRETGKKRLLCRMVFIDTVIPVAKIYNLFTNPLKKLKF